MTAAPPSTPRPRLILIGGVPGAGKTTLAMRLAEHLPVPVLLKDHIKEGISLTEGASASSGGPIAERTFAALYGCVDVLLRHGCTVIAEAAFHRQWFASEIEPFKELAEIRLIVCQVPVALAAARYRERAASGSPRRFAHPDDLVVSRMAEGSFDWQSYELDGARVPTLVVDSAGAYDPPIPAILAFLDGRQPDGGIDREGSRRDDRVGIGEEGVNDL